VVVQVYSFLLLKMFLAGTRRWWMAKRCQPMDLAVVIFALPYTLIVYIWSFFDRYVLMLFILALYGLIRTRPAWLQLNWAGWAIVLAFGWYALAGTHDYLAWNGAVAAKKQELMQSGIAREHIDAGNAQDGWDTGTYRNEAARYFLSWGEMEGYSSIARFEYARWLPGRGQIYVLLKD
jgi:hypothetical protein